MKRILILSIGLLFAGELEVDGVIKANSGIDANNNPITNVGSPITMSDAINGNILQDALRDDGVYEHMFILGRIKYFNAATDGVERWSQYMILSEYQVSSSSWTDGLSSILNQYSSQGWVIQFLDSSPDRDSANHLQVLYQLKRKLSEE